MKPGRTGLSVVFFTFLDHVGDAYRVGHGLRRGQHDDAVDAGVGEHGLQRELVQRSALASPSTSTGL